MSWQGIDEFIAVAKTESFTQSAAKLGCSVAHVSRQISTLETRLGIKLFNRTTRRVLLTDEGSLFFQHCQRLQQGMNYAEHALSQLQSKPQGNITLSAPVAYGEANILPLINDFIRIYPEIGVRVNLSNHRVNLLDEGYDLAIRIGALEDSSLIAKKISARMSYVCASPSYFEKFEAPKTLNDLKHHNCLLGTLDYWRFWVDNQEKRMRLKGNIQYNNGFGLVDAALKGIGIVQLPDYYVRQYIDRKLLIAALDEYRLPDEGVWAVFHHNKQLSPKIKLLIDFLSQNLSPLTTIEQKIMRAKTAKYEY